MQKSYIDDKINCQAKNLNHYIFIFSFTIVGIPIIEAIIQKAQCCIKITIARSLILKKLDVCNKELLF